MDRQEEEQVKQLASEHWKWISKLLEVDRIMTERLFKDGFLHGWKHAKEK